VNTPPVILCSTEKSLHIQMLMSISGVHRIICIGEITEDGLGYCKTETGSSSEMITRLVDVTLHM
jgi:hypothetical protein